MRHFFTEGSFLEYGFSYQNENSPENICLVPLLIFDLWRHKDFLPHSNKGNSKELTPDILMTVPKDQ